MATFEIDRSRFEGGKTNIKKPLEIAHFSYDDNHTLKPFSTDSLRYYYPPLIHTAQSPTPPPVDLSVGFDQFRKRSDSPDEHLDALLDTIEVLERQDGRKVDADFVTWRGMITKFVTALYDTEDGIEMLATRYQGTIFIEDNHEAKIHRDAQQKTRFANQRGGPPPGLAEYWGYKFETLSLLDKPMPEVSRNEIETRQSVVVDNHSQYCSIVRTSIGSNSIVVAGEVDGVMGFKPDDPNDKPKWVELKTARKPESHKDHEIHCKKLLKFWAQSFLIGCPTIIIGYRDRQGKLYELEELETQKIPSMVKNSPYCKWNANACLGATSAILDFLKANIQEGQVWAIRREPGQRELKVLSAPGFGSETGKIVKESFRKWREREKDDSSPNLS